LVCFLPLRPETIDRIAVSVGDRVITSSDLDRQIRVSAFLSGTPADFAPAARRAMAGRMVEQKLVQLEADTTHIVDADNAAIARALDDFVERYFPSPDDYRRALAEAGLTEQDLTGELLRERTFNAFLEIRFQPAVQVNESDIEEYYRKQIAASGIPLAQVHAQIQRTLTAERVDEEVNRWVAEARRRTQIVYHEEAFR
jgi:hypothetical protein